MGVNGGPWSWWTIFVHKSEVDPSPWILINIEKLSWHFDGSSLGIEFGYIRKSVFIKKSLLSLTLENHKHPIDSLVKISTA